MQTWESILTNKSGTFPDTLGVDSSGAATPDGTEFVAAFLNNGPMSIPQAIMDYAAGNANVPAGSVGVPNGVTEAAGVSQIVEAILKMSGTGPGSLVGWFSNDDPSVTGHRVLLMQEQGVLISVYPDLDSAVYVGDANNAAVAAGGGKFYRSSDAAGLTADIAGPYLQLPEGRGYALRGLDVAAAIDPDGASRFLGDNQLDALEEHGHRLLVLQNSNFGATLRVTAGTGGAGANEDATVTDIQNGNVSTETRMSNFTTNWGITY